MRGREAARAANRRAAGLAAELEATRQELAQERSSRKQQELAHREEIRRLKVEQSAEAGRLAAKEVAKQVKAYKEKQQELGLSVEMSRHHLVQKDKLVRNACRYVSMTRGAHPLYALHQVITWMTDEDFAGVPNPAGMVIALGLPPDGWVAQLLKCNQHSERRYARSIRKVGSSPYVSLDRAIEQANEQIHPAFKKSWYPPIEYRGITIVDVEKLMLDDLGEEHDQSS